MNVTLRSPDGRVVVPARLRSRRVGVRRDRGRRRLRRIVAGLVLVALLAGAYALLRSPLLAVDSVTIQGSAHVSRSDVAQATGVSPGTAMIDVSPGTVEKDLRALPWVASATVSRQWPDRIEIRLTDRRPVAQVVAGNTYRLVDDSGRVLATGKGRRADLPVITGVHAGEAGTSVKAAEPLLETVASLPGSVRDDVARIGYAKGRAVELTLVDDGRVKLGRTDQLSAKFSSVATVLDHLGNLKAGCTLDVTVPASPTLTPEYGCA